MRYVPSGAGAEIFRLLRLNLTMKFLLHNSLCISFWSKSISLRRVLILTLLNFQAQHGQPYCAASTSKGRPFAQYFPAEQSGVCPEKLTAFQCPKVNPMSHSQEFDRQCELSRWVLHVQGEWLCSVLLDIISSDSKCIHGSTRKSGLFSGLARTYPKWEFFTNFAVSQLKRSHPVPLYRSIRHRCRSWLDRRQS